MFSARPSSVIRANRCGVALVIVLAFVVLLTGLVLAFFSRAISERQISNSSANGVRVDVLTESAVATVLGDLRQEIAAGSKITQPAAGVNVYTPNAPATAVPCLAGTATTDPLPNLLKRSASGVAFFANASASTAYDTTNYPPSNRASSVSSTVASQNGRIITPARWNKPLLLPKNDPASDTVFTPVNAFKPPDWVVIARNGTNPTTWDGKLAANGNNAAVGRFAYNIYDEGGLLDINAAGYPKDTTVAAPQLNYPAYKQSLAFADLQQLPGIATTGTDSAGRTINGLSPTRQEQVVRTLVGWRNYASTGIDLTQNTLTAGQPVSGSVSMSPGYTWTSKPSFGNVFNYLNFMQVYGVGFMRTVNPLIVNGQSDRSFGSRQQLIDLVLNSVADQSTTGATERAGLQNAMQYLSTFSRSLNQPSYASTFPDDVGRPVVQSGTGGNDAVGGDATINPSFLAVRVGIAKAGGRNDGSDLTTGEPLVKKRFALNRLAWLTYLGPSADHMSDSSVQAAITAMGGNPSNSKDPITQLVAQGNQQNIYNYFGLSWVADPNGTSGKEWIYSHQGTIPLTTAAAPAAKILTLKTVTGREADFFELLKASVTLGSLGKAYAAEQSSSTTANMGAKYITTRAYQANFDTSVDASIIQLGANIIDQSDTDGYPTRILFNNGSFANGTPGKVQEYRGVEDLPYIYRMREGKLRTADSVPTYNSLPQAISTPTNFNAGKCVLLQEPEVWNPHYYKSSAPDTLPRPTSFRIIAVTEDPNYNPTPNIKLSVEWRSDIMTGGTLPQNKGLYDPLITTSAAQPLTADNTEMLFNIPTNQSYLFREPTLLIKPNVPGGSNLSIGSKLNHWVKVLSGGLSFTSLDAATSPGYPSPISDDKSYIGIPLGGEMLPLAWSQTLTANAINNSTNNPAATTNGLIPAQYITVTSGDTITYRLQYLDATNPTPGNMWCTYDEKYLPIVFSASVNTWSNPTGGGQEKYAFMKNALGTDLLMSSFDPRASRFGMHYMGRNGRGQQGQYSPPDYWGGWTAAMAYQNAVESNRPDEYAGFIFDSYSGITNGYTYDCGPTAQGWYVAGAAATASSVMRPGLICQNNIAVASATSNLRYSGDLRNTSPASYNQAPGLTCFADPDGVVRRGMAAHVLPTTTSAATANSGISGQPLKASYNFTSPGTSTSFRSTVKPVDNGNAASRPMMLDRPFRSVAELGNTFSGTPWRNMDFFTPESGDTAMLDVFCISDAGDTNGMVAGKVNLNTRQAPVLQAIIAGAYRDELNVATTNTQATGNGGASDMSQGLVNRTGSSAAGAGRLRNVSELVGKWVGGSSQNFASGSAPYNINGAQAYAGFSGTAANTSAPPSTPENLSYILSQDTSVGTAPATGNATQIVQRYRESAIRALSTAGQTRIWNIMIDLVAQTGRYPQGVGSLDKFLVEGEQRCWVHLAIDRYTGDVIDKQVEIVKE